MNGGDDYRRAMLILCSSPPSPFGRKVKIAAALAGLSDRITVENADTMNPNEALRTQNPLGKIPTLVMGPLRGAAPASPRRRRYGCRRAAHVRDALALRGAARAEMARLPV